MHEKIKQKEFFNQHPKLKEVFTNTKLKWEVLESIYDDYTNNIKQFEVAGNVILQYLQPIEKIHSLRYRIKNPEHLIKKIIRKTQERQKEANENQQMPVEITLENYTTEITDLIGVRALHLYKHDWIGIHDAIIQTWNLQEQPKAYIREGDKDAQTLFEAKGCNHDEHKAGYRSVHYLVKFQPTSKTFIAEIQVRTIFEEGWSEIDHDVRYPNDLDNPILNEYLLFFNRVAGISDEMGSYIKKLKTTLEDTEKNYKKEIKKLNEENKSIIEELKRLKTKSKMEEETKQKLQTVIESLSKNNESQSMLLGIFEPFKPTTAKTSVVDFDKIMLPASINHKFLETSISSISTSNKCKNCEQVLTHVDRANQVCSGCNNKII